MKEEPIIMQPGHIYSITFCASTQLIVRYKSSNEIEHLFFSSIHYWNGHRSYEGNDSCCVMSGIEEIRVATLCEKNTLFQYETEQNIL